MSSADDCNDWEYKKHPNISSINDYGTLVVSQLRIDATKLAHFLTDTRAAHGEMFKGVVPALCPYLAGNYRGADFPCLRSYRVGIGGGEGTIPIGVSMAMALMHQDFLEDLSLVAAARSDPAVKANEADLMLVQFPVLHMVKFLKIHPYANGNGHIGRLIMWIGLGQAGLWPKTWHINARPGWDDLIQRFNKGNKKPLIRFVIRSI